MQENKLTQFIAQKVTSIFNMVLQVEANSTSCSFVYQPKTPEQLSKFRKKK